MLQGGADRGERGAHVVAAPPSRSPHVPRLFSNQARRRPGGVGAEEVRAMAPDAVRRRCS